MAYSIFQDRYYTVPASSSPFSYSVELSGNPSTPIFYGKAWVAPMEDVINVNINKIAENYLEMDFPNLALADLVPTSTVTHTHEGAFRHFILKNSGGTPIQVYDFLLDWSYKEKDFTEDIMLSEPINGHGTDGMYYFSTWWDHDTSPQAVFTNYSLNPSAIMDFDGMAMYKADYCGDIAIYYLNRNGGWDSFLCEGTVKKIDDYTRYSISRPADSNSMNFGKKTYNNQISTRWEVNSGWLNDSESERLAFYLLSSNQVFVHDLKSGVVSPAVLTDASADYKTFNNNGRKLINYTINITLSHTTQNIS